LNFITVTYSMHKCSKTTILCKKITIQRPSVTCFPAYQSSAVSQLDAIKLVPDRLLKVAMVFRVHSGRTGWIPTN